MAFGMTKKNLTIIGTAVVAIILLLTIISARGDKMSVRSDVAKHEDIVNSIVTNGKIEPEEDFQAHAPLATTVKKIYVHEGDIVKKGNCSSGWMMPMRAPQQRKRWRNFERPKLI